MPERALLICNRISLTLFLIVIIDFLIFGSYIKNILPNTVQELTWYYIIFGLPHIVASFISYCSKDYFSYYKKELTKGFLVVIGIFTFFFIALPNLFIYIFIAYGLYHVAWQQLGICRRFVHNKIIYKLWSISGVSTAVSFALSVGGEVFILLPQPVTTVLLIVGIFSLVIFTICTGFLYTKEEYLLTTSLIIIGSALSILMGYYLIGILMIRFIHDATAFSIYISHDRQYQKNYTKNYIYNAFKVSPFYIIIFLPLFSITIAFFTTKK